MPSSAHFAAPKISIALILLASTGLLGSSALQSAETLALPPLGNTEELDRVLTQEVTDSFVFGWEEIPAKNGINADEPVKDAAPAGTASGTTGTKTQAKSAIPNAAPATAKSNSAQLEWENPSKSDDWLPSLTKGTDPDDTVWEVIQRSNRLPLANNDRVDFYKEQYVREALWISKILHRGKPFLSHLVATLDQRFMPVELALLPAIESGFQTKARSSGNATGLWQIVPITAREIGIVRDVWFDGRGDILKSTTAAIDYLSYLNAEFNGDWELTLAAYNAGPGRVRQAIKKNADAGLNTDYWSLDLPEETHNYVPKLIALVDLMKQKDLKGFDIPDIRMVPAFESIDIGLRVSLDKVAQLTGIDEDQLRLLNAGLIHGVTAPDGPHRLLIPAGTGETIQTAFADVDEGTLFSEPKTHEVVAGDSVSTIALKYGISQQRLLNMNGLDSTAIKIGQKLAVLDGRNLPESVVEYVVTIGDTLSEIASKFSVNMRDITQSDGQPIGDALIHPGDTLMITVSQGSAG